MRAVYIDVLKYSIWYSARTSIVYISLDQLLAHLVHNHWLIAEYLPPCVKEVDPLLAVLILHITCLIEVTQKAIDFSKRQDASDRLCPLVEAAQWRDFYLRLTVGVPRADDGKSRR